MTWNYTYTPTIWLPISTVLLLIALSIYSGRRRSVPGTIPFAIGSLFAALWVTGSIMEIAATTVPIKIFWIKAQTIWQLPTITAITCFVLEYTWPGRWLTRRNLALLSIAPLLTLLLILTNDLHHWMWPGFSFDESVRPLYGPAYWFYLTYGYGFGFIEILVFGWLFLHSPAHRWPAAFMLAGLLAARIIHILSAANLIHSELSHDVLSIALVFLAYAVALFAFRIFDPIPLAHQTVITQIRDGVLVLDLQERVANLNPAAETILGVSARQALGRPLQELLPSCANLCENLHTTRLDQAEITLGTGAETRHYILTTSFLKDWHGLDIGCLLLLHDVTEQKQAQVQIVEQQQALAMLHERERLARELHDSLGQIFAFISTQGQTARRLLNQGNIAAADAHIDRLVEVAREADVDIRESILGLRVTLSEQNLFTALAQYLIQYEKNYNIHTRLEVPETLGKETLDPLVEVQLLRILQEALTNIRKHARARCVCITVALENGWARIIVQDDGQGFDPHNASIGSQGHVGLRVMHERAQEVGGSFSLYTEPGQGTQVTVRVPVKRGAKSAEHSIRKQANQGNNCEEYDTASSQVEYIPNGSRDF